MIAKAVRVGWVFCAVLGWTVSAAASPVGSRLEEQGRWNAGGEFNFMLDRDLSGGVEAESNQYMATAAYGITDRISALVKLGAADLEESGVPDFDTSFAYGVGLRAKLVDMGPWELIASPQYFSIVEPNTNIGAVDVDGSWHEFQGSLVVARSFPLRSAEYSTEGGQNGSAPQSVIRPYAGLKVSEVSADREFTFPSGAQTETDLDADDHVGLVAGGEADMGQWAVAVEGRAIDESAITLAVNKDF